VLEIDHNPINLFVRAQGSIISPMLGNVYLHYVLDTWFEQTVKITRGRLEQRVQQALRREHLSAFVVTQIAGTDKAPTFQWRVDRKLRRRLETTRLYRRVLFTDRHNWSMERIVHGFRGQWNVEEIFRRAEGGGLVPWGPSHQWADDSLQLHTFATVLGLMLVSLAHLALGARCSAKSMMDQLGEVKATLLRPSTGKRGRPPTVPVRPKLTRFQQRAAEEFELERWMPAIFYREEGSVERLT